MEIRPYVVQLNLNGGVHCFWSVLCCITPSPHKALSESAGRHRPPAPLLRSSHHLSGQLVHRKSFTKNQKFVFRIGFPSGLSRQTRIVPLSLSSPKKSSTGTIRQTNWGKQVWVKYSQSSKSEPARLVMAPPQMNFFWVFFRSRTVCVSVFCTGQVYPLLHKNKTHIR